MSCRLTPRKCRSKIFLSLGLLSIFGLLILKLHIPDVTVTTKLKKPKAELPFYRRRHRHDCRQFFDSVDSKLETSRASSQSTFQIWREMQDCQRIRHRLYYPGRPLTATEEHFPLAFAILVDDHLEQIELLLNSIYMPQNWYCIHVDIKAPYVIHDAVRKLASCFPNIFVSSTQLPITSQGVNMIRAFLACFEQLLKNSKAWNYMLPLQGHDFPLRTNAELVQILQLHDGANDVELLPSPQFRYAAHWQLKRDKDGFPAELQKTNVTKSPNPDSLQMYKGSIAAAFSRRFVEFLLTSPKAQRLVAWLDDVFLADELYWSTLNHDEKLEAPGGYPGRCVSESGRKMWISRFAVWNSYKHLQCKGSFRHSVCIFSAKDLPMLRKRPELFLNKFWLPYDASAIYCMHELLFNRTYMPQLYPKERYGFDEKFYLGLSGVKYQQANKNNLSTSFKCITCSDCDH